MFQILPETKNSILPIQKVKLKFLELKFFHGTIKKILNFKQTKKANQSSSHVNMRVINY